MRLQKSWTRLLPLALMLVLLTPQLVEAACPTPLLLGLGNVAVDSTPTINLGPSGIFAANGNLILNASTIPHGISAGSIRYGGTLTNNGGYTSGTVPISGTYPNPYMGLTPPSQPAHQVSGVTFNTSPTTLYPGYYSDSNVNINSGVVCLQPGIYYMNGTWTVNAGATITMLGQAPCNTVGLPAVQSDSTTGYGVLLYFVNGNLNLNSNASVSLTPPAYNSNDPYQGITYWQSSTMGTTLQGTANLGCGVWYQPSAALTINGGSTLTALQTIAAGFPAINGTVAAPIGCTCTPAASPPTATPEAPSGVLFAIGVGLLALAARVRRRLHARRQRVQAS